MGQPRHFPSPACGFRHMSLIKVRGSYVGVGERVAPNTPGGKGARGPELVARATHNKVCHSRPGPRGPDVSDGLEPRRPQAAGPCLSIMHFMVTPRRGGLRTWESTCVGADGPCWRADSRERLGTPNTSLIQTGSGTIRAPAETEVTLHLRKA